MRKPAPVGYFRGSPARSTRHRLATARMLAVAAGLSGPAAMNGQQAGPPPACCRELDYLYEASIFKVDAMRMRVTVDDVTAVEIERVVRSAPRSGRLENEIARRYRRACTATVNMEFVVGLSGETFVAHSINAFRELVGDGVLSAEEANAFSGKFRTRFSFLEGAKVRPGDRLLYEVVADTLTTTYSRGGAVLMHDRQVGRLYRDITLATYFAPSSDFRRGLVDKVFRP